MDFSDKELKIVLQALYRYRGEVSGATQTEQNKFGFVETVIGKIEGKIGPLTSEKTKFDREMEESLAVLKTGRVGATRNARAKAAEEKESSEKKVAAKPAAPAKKAAAPLKAAKALDKNAGAAKSKKETTATKTSADKTRKTK